MDIREICYKFLLFNLLGYGIWTNSEFQLLHLKMRHMPTTWLFHNDFMSQYFKNKNYFSD